jgi:hypothetical protein
MGVEEELQALPANVRAAVGACRLGASLVLGAWNLELYSAIPFTTHTQFSLPN